MPYVMVPVPEEHVEEVMTFMLRVKSRANLEPWDEESVKSIFDELDEFGRSLLAFVGRSASNQRDLSEADAAKLLQLSSRETIAIVREINDLCRDAGRPSLILRRTFAEVQPNGRTVDVPVLAFDEELVPFVNAAVDADRAANPIPGDG